MSFIHLTKNHTFHDRTKQVVRYHFVREMLEEDDIRVEKVDNNNNNPRNILTKVVTRIKVKH